MINIIKAHAVNNLCYITAQKMTPKGIVIHSTGANNPNLKRYVNCPDKLGVNTYGNHWDQATPNGQKICVHAFVGYDKNKKICVAEILPMNICCWGVGKGNKGSYNYNPAYIQIEICEDGLNDRSYYKNVFSVAADYCVELCKTYGISVEKIVGHCEAYKQGYGSNHSDPEHWMKKFGETMNDFRTQVSSKMESNRSDSAYAKTHVSELICKGDLVSIAKDAVYYNGKTVPEWVKSQNWYVKDAPQGDRVVIDKSQNGTKSICSPIHRKFLTVVKSTNKTVDYTGQSYLVRVTANSLNIRKNAGTDSPIVGAIKDKGLYTIVEEKDGCGATKWGRLKSGVGWISLDYVVKV